MEVRSSPDETLLLPSKGPTKRSFGAWRVAFSKDERTLISDSSSRKKRPPYLPNGPTTEPVYASPFHRRCHRTTWSVSSSVPAPEPKENPRRRLGDKFNPIGGPMRGRSILVSAVLVGGAVVGGTAALKGGAASNTATTTSLATTTTNLDATTRIHSLSTEAERLGGQITIARTKLSALEQLVLSETAQRRAASRPNVPSVSTVSTGAASTAPSTAPTTTTTSTTAPTTQTTTGASSSTTDDNSNSNGGSGDN